MLPYHGFSGSALLGGFLGLITTAITVTGVIINIFQGGPVWSALGGSVLPTIIFIYLLTPNVRRAFGM